MYRYDGVLRLSGSINNEVVISKASAAEIRLMRVIHGNDAVVKLQELAPDRSDHEEERAKLLQKYVGVEEEHSEDRRTKVPFYTMFPEYTPLPNRLREFEVAEQKEEEKADPSKIPYRRNLPKVDVEMSEVDPDDIAG